VLDVILSKAPSKVKFNQVARIVIGVVQFASNMIGMARAQLLNTTAVSAGDKLRGRQGEEPNQVS
jgi:hypothetical protein